MGGYAEKHKQNQAECANTRCSERGCTLRVFHGQVNWYCSWHAEQIDQFQGRHTPNDAHPR
jgi:hypothetical protein